MGIVSVLHDLHRAFLAGIGVHPRGAGVKHALLDQLTIGSAVAVTDLEQLDPLAVVNLTASGISVFTHPIDRAHYKHPVRAFFDLGDGFVIWTAGELGFRAIWMAHHAHVGTGDLESIFGQLLGQHVAGQTDHDDRKYFQSCHSVHAGQTTVTERTLQAAISKMIWMNHRRPLDLTHFGQVMGILNVTPDSFSDGGLHVMADAALAHARRLITDGAAIIDIGGESTRPGSQPVSAGEEMARTLGVISAVRAEWDGWISIDTSKACVAEAALAAGADIVNDVSGLRADPDMATVCAARGCGVVVMHMKGEPRTMQGAPHYDDVVAEVKSFFVSRLEELTQQGIDLDCLCFDPGIGFGKTLNHNLELLRTLDSLAPQGWPILLGVSRKSFIGKILRSDDFALRDWPTVALTAQARMKGVMLHRVHDVRPNLQAIRMTEAILGEGG